MDTDGGVDNDEEDDRDDTSEQIAEPEDVVVNVFRVISHSCYSVVPFEYFLPILICEIKLKHLCLKEFWNVDNN